MSNKSNDKATFVYGEKGSIMIGSKEGRVTYFNLGKPLEMETFVLPQPIMKSVI